MQVQNRDWELLDTDPTSGRQIYKADVDADVYYSRKTQLSRYGTYDFKVFAFFEVRDKDGQMLLETSGSASGEYWCGVFLWFVEGSNGTKVRLEESDASEDRILDVPDQATVSKRPMT